MIDRTGSALAAGAAAAMVLGACGSSPATPSTSPPPIETAPPTFAPGAAVIAFHSDPDGHDDFYLTDPSGSLTIQLTSGAETVAFPVWSPDGRLIAYECCSGFNAKVYVMNANGTDQHVVSQGRAGAPAWAPDGELIAYDDHDEGALWIVAPDGTGSRRLAAQAGGAAWSPDGRSIAFFSRRDFPGQDQRNEIYVMDADGRNQRRLTENSAEDVEPVWSPDGTRIAFDSTRDGNAEIYVMGSDGSGQRRLTPDPPMGSLTRST